MSHAARSEGKPSVWNRIWNQPHSFWVQLLCVLLILVCLQTALILFVSGGVKMVSDDRIYHRDEVDRLAAEGAFDGADCILVLGAGVRNDGSLSSVLEDRVRTACRVYATCDDQLLLMSGDKTGDYDEPRAMSEFACMTMGVPSDDVVQDKKGYSTYESLMRLKQVSGVQKIVIVTQRYHLYRALFIAERLGIEAIGVAADSPEFRCPTKNEVREILARFRDMFRSEREETVPLHDLPIMVSVQDQ